MGIICLGGQEVGDWKSGDQMGLGPNASQPKTNDQTQSSFNFKSLCSSRKENEGGKRASFLSCLFGSSKV